MPGATGSVSFEVSQKDIARVQKKLKAASGKPLYVRMQRATLTAGDLVSSRIKGQTPRGPTGNLKRYTKSRLGRRRMGPTSLMVLVGPTSRHRHLVIRGTKERPSVGPRPSSPYRVLPGRGGETFRGRALSGVHVVRAGTYTVGRMRPNPYVDRAARGFERQAAELVRKEWAAALR